MLSVGFNKKEAKIKCNLENLESFIKKNFNVFIDVEEELYIVNIQQGMSVLKRFSTCKENGMNSLLAEAEDWAKDFIEQFNSDRENTL